jgi:hypothetical protein
MIHRKKQFKLSTQIIYELIIKFLSYDKKNEYFLEKKTQNRKNQKIKTKIISFLQIIILYLIMIQFYKIFNSFY